MGTEDETMNEKATVIALRELTDVWKTVPNEKCDKGSTCVKVHLTEN